MELELDHGRGGATPHTGHGPVRAVPWRSPQSSAPRGRVQRRERPREARRGVASWTPWCATATENGTRAENSRRQSVFPARLNTSHMGHARARTHSLERERTSGRVESKLTPLPRSPGPGALPRIGGLRASMHPASRALRLLRRWHAATPRACLAAHPDPVDADFLDGPTSSRPNPALSVGRSRTAPNSIAALLVGTPPPQPMPTASPLCTSCR